MVKFIKNVLLAAILSLAVFLLVRAYTIQYRVKSFHSAFVDKLQMLAKNKNRKKIILIGGSSVGFGISAELIEKQTGVKTINLGQDAGFGLIDFEDFILKNLTHDDIIIFAPEWVFYENPRFVDQGIMDNLINENINYGETIRKPWHVIKSIFSPVSAYEFSRSSMQNNMDKAVRPYIYKCFNANGDIVAHCGLKPKGPKSYDVHLKIFNLNKFTEAFPFVFKFKTMIVFPPTQTAIYQKNKNDFKNLENALRKEKLTVPGSIENNVYPDSCFFDAEYHLTCKTRVKRTMEIISYLKKIYGAAYLNYMTQK